MSKIFTDRYGLKLEIKKVKQGIVFKCDKFQNTDKYNFRYFFENETFKDLLSYAEEISNEKWNSFEPREATSEASDYYEYFDRELDNNGVMTIKDCSRLFIERPSLESNIIYRLNKRKMESFIYDLREYVNK